MPNHVKKAGLTGLIREICRLQEKETKIILKLIAEVSVVLKEGTKRTKNNF